MKRFIIAAAFLLAACATGQQLNREGRELVDAGQFEEGVAKLDAAASVEPGNLRYRLDLLRAIVYVGYPALVPERRRTPYQEKARWWTDGAVPQAAKPEPAAVQTSGIAIDPVCKMEVEIATADYSSEYGGVTYYFCAPGCKTAFDADPATYAGLNRNE